MDETKQNWLPWFIAAGAVFLLIRNQQPGQDTSKPAITAVVRTTLPTIREAYRSAFLEAAKKIEDGSIKDQEQWTRFIEDNAGTKRREALDKVYKAIDELDLPASFVGKESEIAKLNRQIAEAW
jgi:hypothetical protein